MNILMIGDVVGEPGRKALGRHLARLVDALKVDAVVVNGENAAHGIGITPAIAEEILAAGAHCITGGNHSFGRREIIPFMADEPRLIRPANYPEGAPGNGIYSFRCANGRYVTVVNLMARLFIEIMLDCPFRKMDAILKNLTLGKGSNAIIVDFHGEATSEKIAMGYYLDGRVSAVLGTHTHIPTADHRILPGGTAYQTDVGMTGCYDSVIGMDKTVPIEGFVSSMRSARLEPAQGEGCVCGTLVSIDPATGLAKAIKPVRIGGKELEQTGM